MALIDRGIAPRGNLTDSLIAIASQCPDCLCISVADLRSSGSLRSIHRDKPDQLPHHRNVRMPDDVHARLVAQAETDRRSLNAEILWFIERGLPQQEGGSGVSSPA